jgi:hypothetical protein
MSHDMSNQMREGDAALRLEMNDGDAALRLEMREMGAALSKDIVGLGATLRLEMSNQRVELLKWSFVFSLSQVVTIAAIMGVMLRTLRP